MRRTCAMMLVGALAVLGAGCVMVIGVRDRDERDVVEVNGETYLIDRETGKAHKVRAEVDPADANAKSDASQ